jgi:WD40 repeat protein
MQKMAKSYKQKAYLGRYPYNLVESNNLAKYYKCLTDFGFLAAKVKHPELGVQALIEDYDLIDDAELLTHPEYNGEKVKSLKLIQGALRLSAHILAQDPTQLVEQLWGRLLYFEMPEIKALLEVARQSKTTGLRALIPNLTPPGGRLLRTLTGHSFLVSAVAISSDGKLAISGSWDNKLKVWNLQQGKELFTLTGHSSFVSAVAIVSDGKLAISGSDDYMLKVWNLAEGKELFTLTGHSRDVNAVAISSDGKLAISGSDDYMLKVWNLQQGKELFTLTGHSDSVSAVAISSDGKLAISGSWDNTLKVWNLATREVIASFVGESAISCCAVTPDGLTIVAGEESGRVHFLRLEC